MSMISKLIDGLRQMADGQATYRDAREMMLQATDTIWQLRYDLQRANAAVQDAEHDESVAWDRVRKAEAENVKLRELARGLHMAYVGALNECEGMDSGLIWEHCEMVDAELAKSHARFESDRHRFDVAMGELGVDSGMEHN